MNVKLNIIKYRYFITTIFLIVLGIILNLPINKNFKLSLLLLGIVICIFDPMLTVPFILIIIIMYNLNIKIKKLNKNKQIPKQITEGFLNNEQNGDYNTFITFLRNPTNEGATDAMKNTFKEVMHPKNRESLLNLINDENNNSTLVQQIEFIDELLKTYFFKENDFLLICKLANRFNTYDNLYSQLEFTDISLEQGFNNDNERTNLVNLLSGRNKTLKRLGIFFYKINNLNYLRYLLFNSYHLGLYTIVNNYYNKDTIKNENSYVSGNTITTETLSNRNTNENVNYNTLKERYTDREIEYQNIIKSIKEIVLLMFYRENKSTDANGDYYDFNDTINLDRTLSVFDLIKEDFLDKVNNNELIEKRFNSILSKLNNYQLVEKRTLTYNNNNKINQDIFNSDESKKLYVDKTTSVNNNNIVNIDDNSIKNAMTNSNSMENQFDIIFDSILDNFDNINIFALQMTNLSNREKRRKFKFNMYNYLSLFYFISNTKIQSLLRKIHGDNNQNNATKRHFITLFKRKQNKFNRQMKNENDTGEQYQFTNPLDFFYDNMFFFYKIKYGNEANEIKKVLDIPNKIIISTGDDIPLPLAPSEKDDDEEENPFSEVQQREFELGLDDYLTEDKLKDKQEEALTKYYEFLDKENYSKIQTLNSLAEARNENLKIEKISLGNIVDTFGSEIFNIIDEINELFHRTFNPKYTPSPSLEEFHSGLYDNEGDTPSISGKDSLHKYIYFFKELIKILTKEERIYHTGFIMVVLGFFVYFIDNSESQYIQQPKIPGFLKYL